MNRTTVRLLIVSLVVVGAVGYLILTGVKATGMRYLTVTELAQMPRAPKSEGFRLDGKVVPGSIQYDQKEPNLAFHMTDGKAQVAVQYQGLMPDAFADGREVVVEGTYHQDRRVLEASKLVTKCPSKYEPQGLGRDKS
jgi:cytochrome c-type biogenesis protein CcmE